MIFPLAIVVTSSLVALAGCATHELSRSDPEQDLVESRDFYFNNRRKLDVLFVIDNSGSMAQHQTNLTQNFGAFVTALQMARPVSGGGFAPDLHIGVVTTDAGCGSGTGDNGDLQTTRHMVDSDTTEACAMLQGNSYIADDGLGGMNYQGALVDAFACMASVGVKGCGFEAPLESMKRALDDNPNNTGFLRDDAYLQIILFTDEDDCSAGSPNLFNGSEDPYGPLDSFRCFDYGVTCDEVARAPGAGVGTSVPLHNCVPNPQADALVTPIDGYVDFLQGLKEDSRDVMVATITGNATPVSVSLQGATGNNPGWFQVDPSCSVIAQDDPSRTSTAMPGIRLDAFRQRFPDRNYATIICDPDISDGLVGFAELLGGVIGNPCWQGILADTNPDLEGLQFECAASQVVGGAPSTTMNQCNENSTNAPCWRVEPDLNCPLGPANQMSTYFEWGGPPPTDTLISMQCVVAGNND